MVTAAFADGLGVCAEELTIVNFPTEAIRRMGSCVCFETAGLLMDFGMEMVERWRCRKK